MNAKGEGEREKQDTHLTLVVSPDYHNQVWWDLGYDSL